VDGKKIDECVQDFNVDHWHRASFSHAVAVAHARTRSYNNVAVVVGLGRNCSPCNPAHLEPSSPGSNVAL
jgi:hypothetical protein